MHVLERMVHEARRNEEDCIYNSIAHFQASKRWRLIAVLLNLPACLLTALAAFFAFTEESQSAGWLSVAALLQITAYLFLQPDEKSQRFFSAGQKFSALRGDFRRFAELECSRHHDKADEHMMRLQNLVKRKDELNSDGPDLPDWAYKRARKRVIEGGPTHDVDQERS